MRRLACLLVLAGVVARLAAQPADTLAGEALPGLSFADAHALRTDVSGRLYVADPGRPAVIVLEADASPRTLLSGSDAVRLVEPVDLDPTNGLLLYVADAGAGQIIPVGADGLYLAPLGAETAAQAGRFAPPADPSAFAPRGVAVSPAGDVWAVDEAGRLLRWDASRTRTVVSGPDEGVLVRPRALALHDGRLFVLDDRGLALFDAFGTLVRRVAWNVPRGAVRVRALQEGVVLVYPDGLVLVDRAGGRLRAMAWQGPPLRDVAEVPGGWMLLTPRLLFRAPR